MATTTKTPSKRASSSATPRKPSTAAKKAPAKPRGSSAGGGKGSGGGPRKPGLAARAFRSARSHVGDQSQDVYGIALILVGVLVAMGMYWSAGGPVGAFFEAVFRGLFGVFGYAAPPILIYSGGLIVVGKPKDERGRIAVGALLVGIAVIGAWHLIKSAPEPSDGIKALWPASGLLGWVISRPLVVALSVWGASAVFTALAVLGTLIVTKTPFSDVIARTKHLFHPGDEADRPVRAKRQRRAASAAGDAGATTPEEEPKRTRARGSTAAIPSAERSAENETVEVEVPRRRRSAMDAAATGTQPPIPGTRDDDGDGEDPHRQSAADREAGRVPEPAAAVAPSAAEIAAALAAAGGVAAAVGVQKARKILPQTDFADYRLPPVELMGKGRSVAAKSRVYIDGQVDALQATFDQFGIDASVARYSRGPTVTRFEIELGPGVQVRKVANLGDDIAYALAAPDVRIVAPIPGKSAIGVEVPNRERDRVTLRDILESDVAKADAHPMLVALGVDIAGNPAMVNLTTMPHLLVCGATGSGKSVTLNAMISSIVTRARPDQVRMILIDPKRVELNAYEGVPHLLTPVVTDARRAADAVQWCVKEMEMRYETLARLGFRNIDGYNEAVAEGKVPAATEAERDAYSHMPYILLVIDELADLMLVAPRDVEDSICRIAQMARAVGIHMVIATQRPSVDVITGLIKANIPSRLALAVASQTDSRTILDAAGAEKLVGHGDMLFLPASQGKPSRLQGCFVSEKEVSTLVDFCKKQREATFVEGVVKVGKDASNADTSSRGSDDDTDEVLVRRAAELVVRSGLGSTSMLQRKLRIGFARAGRVMDELEELGVVGENEGSKARSVLWSEEQFENAMQDGTF